MSQSSGNIAFNLAVELLPLYLVVVVQQSQRCCTVLITIDAHHGFRSSCQWVLQVALPRLIFAAEYSARRQQNFIWYNHHQPLTERTARQQGET